MKAEELMINDWVQAQFINGTEYAVVKSILRLHAYIECEGLQYAHSYSQGILPIPLTEEILELNGFERKPHDTFRELKVGENKLLVSIRTGGWIEKKGINGFSKEMQIYGVEMKYVHQFQHALRLLGYTELADNLKVK